jgi:hypothetical protein
VGDEDRLTAEEALRPSIRSLVGRPASPAVPAAAVPAAAAAAKLVVTTSGCQRRVPGSESPSLRWVTILEEAVLVEPALLSCCLHLSCWISCIHVETENKREAKLSRINAQDQDFISHIPLV